MLTLWDLLPVKRKGRRRDERPDPPAPPARITPPPGLAVPAPARRRPTMRERYHEMERELLRRHGIRVRKWRTSMSGVAWQVTYADGTTSRLIEAPRPRGPMSAAVFLHEIGHHVIGFNRYRPRCLEEYHAWAWALAEMERRGLNVTDAVRRRMAESLRYAVSKGVRRGLKAVPAELRDFLGASDDTMPQRSDGGSRASVPVLRHGAGAER